MKKNYQRLILVICFFFAFVSQIAAQCDVNSFTLTAVNGSCSQDGKITVNIPGGTSCGSATATIRKKGSITDDTFVSLSASGVGNFNNLAPGDYEVKVQQSTTTTVYKSVKVTSSYTPITVTATPKNTTCSNTDPLYTNNGVVSVKFSGGNGPFTITLTGPGGPYTYTTNTAGTHDFVNLAPGNYIATVTDNSSSCTSAESRSATVNDTGWIPMSYSTTRRQLTTDCKIYLRVEFTDGNKQATLVPGNATYTIEGDSKVYNLISTGVPATGRYGFRTEYGLPENKNITIRVTDGCRVFTKVIETKEVTESWDVQQLKTIVNQNCQAAFSFTYKIWDLDSSANVYYWHFSNGVKAAFYAEVPAMSNNWVLIQENFTDSNLFGVAGWLEFQTTYIDTRIKVVFSDSNGCNGYEKIVDGRNVKYANNLDKVVLKEISGVLEGTSTISVDKNTGANWSGTDSFSYPMTFSIARKDGQKNMTVNAAQPYSIAGSYNINFPYVKTVTTYEENSYWNSARPIFGDLPLGEYVVTITDGCGYSITREINLTKPASYTPIVKYELGCAASNVTYDMGVNADTQNVGRVYIYKNNNGVRGNLVTGYNANQILKGQFPSIAPGEYFLVFDNVNYYPRLNTTLPYDSVESNVSVSRNVSGMNQEYYVSFTVDPYKQMSFGTSSLFCDPTNVNSGILAISASGIPVGKITYSIWKSDLDPSTAVPTQTYTTTNLSEMEHVFTNLSAGDYFVRVINDCGFTEQKVKLTPGAAVYPEPVGVPGKICSGKDETATLAIALPSSLFDIEWFDNNNVSIGKGSNVDVKPNTTTTYTVKYGVKASFGCSSVVSNSAQVNVEVEDCVCYKQPTTTGTVLATNHGITALGRAGLDNSNWPMVRKGAWTVLESNTKGFVINRIATTAEVMTIANPVEGMMVYDEQEDCLKIYTSLDSGRTYTWKCFNVQSCPEN